MKSQLTGLPPDWNQPLATLLARLPVYAIDSEMRDETSWHAQPGLELNLTCEGRGWMQAGSRRFSLMPGTLVFLPTGIPHQLAASTPGRYMRSLLCVSPSGRSAFAQVLYALLKQTPFRSVRCLHLSEKNARQMRDLLAAMARETRYRARWWNETIHAQACQVLAMAARFAGEASTDGPPAGTLPDEVASHVLRHLDGDLSATHVADIFKISREHLSRVFRQHFGITYKHYIVNQRLQQARGLLLHGRAESSLLDVALACGFQSQSHFSRLFKEHEGMTPSQFRLLHRIG